MNRGLPPCRAAVMAKGSFQPCNRCHTKPVCQTRELCSVIEKRQAREQHLADRATNEERAFRRLENEVTRHALEHAFAVRRVCCRSDPDRLFAIAARLRSFNLYPDPPAVQL